MVMKRAPNTGLKSTPCCERSQRSENLVPAGDFVRAPARGMVIRAGFLLCMFAIAGRTGGAWAQISVPASSRPQVGGHAALPISSNSQGEPNPAAERGRTRSPHGSLSIACERCHSATSWKPIRPVPEFNHNETRFPLRALHVSVDCRQCHLKLVFSDVGGNCANCHADVHRRQFGGACEQCHSVKGWTVSVQSIRGHQNRFPLLGAHAAVECEACHKNAAAGQYVGLSTACSSCHMQDFRTAKAFDHQAAQVPVQCDLCHRMDSWGGAGFDHARFGGFALTGAHARLECVQCHVGNRFAGTPADCFGCHAKDFNTTTNPNHVQAGFDHSCQICHSTTTWSGAKFDHNTATRFPLTGAHAAVACSQCHTSGRFAAAPTDCYSCHIKDFQATRNPDHKAGNFPTDCSICHTTVNWLNAKFDHNLTKFPLTGAHASVPCTSCHVSGAQYSVASTACQSCHLKDFTGAANPNHVAAGFPQDCSICHTTVQWKGAKFDHATMTKFPLTGAHVNVSCADCHKNNVFAGLATACASCHMADFNNAKNPNHVAAGFPQSCEMCHNTTQWQGAKFDHNLTKFPLTGAHTTVSCQSCHGNNQFATLSTACASCHLADFNGAKSPNHVAAGFPQDCAMCHNTTQWMGAKFDHTSMTKFPLTGAHVNVACSTCHVNNVFAGLSTACFPCHQADFAKTGNPNHAAAGFPQDCSLCHNTTSWAGAIFNHNTATKFPLTGAHVTVSCNSCHQNNVFAGLSTACVSCHLADWKSTNNPNHTAAGFPQDCSLCHGVVAGWAGATFNHNTATTFPLTGAHTTVACSTCHKNNVFAGLSTACVSCHLADFNGTTNPNHAAAGFPQDCSICHTTTSWAGAVFDHSKTPFPLTGAHLTAPCASCHLNNNYSTTPTDCYSCHSAEYKSTTSPNHAAAGFPTTCQTCHTTTAWTGATFNHTWFPMNHGNAQGVCSTCHTNPNDYSVFQCTNCHLKPQTDARHTGVRNYVYNSANCYACHQRG